MSILKGMEGGTGFLKATFQGFPKSGKSYTAMELALGTRKVMGLDGPVAYFDTEGAAGYLAPKVLEETGQVLLGVRSRSLDDVTTTIRDCEAEGISVLVIDSVTHIWKNLCDSWLTSVNEQRKRKRQPKLARLPMSAWMPLKARWFSFMDLYLTSRLNIILCARVAFDYDFGENDEGSMEIQKTGVKISAEKDTGYESSLLIEMERVESREGSHHSAKKIIHRATVLGDRFGVIDGATCDDPTFDFFAPHVALLRPDEHSAVDTSRRPDTGADEDGNDEWRREKRQREILCEEIKHELTKRWPGMTKDEKLAKANAVEKHFGTGSWTKVETMKSHELRVGLEALREETSDE